MQAKLRRRRLEAGWACVRSKDWRDSATVAPTVRRKAEGRLGQVMSTYSTYVAYRIDRWDANGYSVIEHVASAEDLMVARAAYEAACKRWPGEMITLRQGLHVLEDSRKTRLA